jgi:hypothetical protein
LRHVRPQPPVVIPRRLIDVTETSRFVTGYIYSRSRKDPESPYAVSLDLKTFKATCSCKHGRYRGTMERTEDLCWHAERLVEYVIRRSQLRVVSA